MKWTTVAGILLYLSRCNAGVLKCTPESQEPLCVSEKRDISPPPSVPDAECLAGSEWESNCHFCRCSDSGIAECLKQVSCDLQQFEEPIKCKPFTTFLRDCNTCTCLENGLGLCTLAGCEEPIDSDRKKRQVSAQDGQKVCTPGTRWKESCNSCWCTNKGISYCTNMGCAGYIVKSEVSAQADPKQCKPGTTWKENCNSCRCGDDGIPDCTKKECLGYIAKREVSAQADPKECVPGTRWKESCNSCWCTDDGISYCTKKECVGYIAKRQASAQDMQKKCKPGTTWKESCNSCWCTDDGISVCTKIGCMGNIVKRHVSEQDDQKECTPGTRWEESCNSCWCTDDGISYCTRVECEVPRVEKRDTSTLVSKHKQNHVIVKRGVCKPNQKFEIDCNTCKCAANGQSYTCAHSECLESDSSNKDVEVFMESEGADHIERHSVCKPRDTFYVGCNTCHCNPFGTDYSCTNNPCPLPKDVEIFHELKAANTTPKSTNTTKRVVCVANRMFIKDCNTCWCNEDGTSFYCTRRICIPDTSEEIITEDPEDEMKLRVVEKECRPNEVFELDCNMCRCDPDGKSFSCTRRACFDVDEKNRTYTRKTRTAPESQKACQPGTEFRMDCNKCLCNDEGHDFSCTRNDCAAQNGNGGGDSFASARSKRETSETVAMQCVAGTVFDRKCNVCRCTPDGLHAVCTIKRCKQDTSEAETESTPSFRCTPGDQFKQDCKDCTCSADGKNVFCTIRICDQVISDIGDGQ